MLIQLSSVINTALCNCKKDRRKTERKHRKNVNATANNLIPRRFGVLKTVSDTLKIQ